MTSVTTSLIEGTTTAVAVKAPVRAATTANITLSAAQTIDGVSVVADDRVLVKNQTTTTENGIYIAAASTWTRALDFDGSRDMVTGTRVFVISGTTNALTEWYVSTASDPDPGDAMAFSQVTVPATVSITGLTAETAPDTADLALIYDDSEAANNKVTLNNLWKVVNTFTAETAVDTADVVGLYDASAATSDKATVNNLLKAVTTFTAETAVDDADEILLIDTSAGTADKATVANLLKSLTTLTDTVIAATDEILFADVSDSNNAKKDTVQGILDLVTTGGLTLISTASASASATIDITGINSTYAHYIIIVTNLVPATDGQALYVRTSTDGGSTFAAGVSDYAWSMTGNSTGGLTSSDEDDADSEITLPSCGNSAGESSCYIINIFNPAGTAANKIIGALAFQYDAVAYVSITTGVRLATADVDAIRFIMASGNITSGEFRLYGVKTS